MKISNCRIVVRDGENRCRAVEVFPARGLVDIAVGLDLAAEQSAAAKAVYGVSADGWLEVVFEGDDPLNLVRCPGPRVTGLDDMIAALPIGDRAAARAFVQAQETKEGKADHVRAFLARTARDV